MPIGIQLKQGRAAAVDLQVRRNSLLVTRVFDPAAAAAAKPVKRAVLGLPLQQVTLKTVVLPPLSRRELPKAVELQRAYHFPDAGPDFLVVHQTRPGRKGCALLLVATARPPGTGSRTVVPEPLALYGLAAFRQLLAPGRRSLLVQALPERLLSVAVDGLDVVFMRSVRKPTNLMAELRLAAQAVYLREERTMLELDQVVWLGDAVPPPEELNAEWPDKVTWLKAGDILDVKDSSLDRNELLVPAGLALLGTMPRRIKAWNVAASDVPVHAAVQRGILYSLPLWPVFLLLYYMGDVRVLESRLAAVTGRRDALAPQQRQSQELLREVTLMEQFLKRHGAGMQSPQIWSRTMETLARNRPDGLRLTALSGTLDGVVLVSGKAVSYSDVTAYLRGLQASADLREPVLIYSRGAADGGVDFQVSFRMTAPPQSRDVAGGNAGSGTGRGRE